MKRLLLLIAAIIAMLSTTAFASSDIGVTINGKVLEMEQPPVTQNGRTLVPVRAVCEAMNLNVVWNQDTKEVKIFDEDTLVKMSIGYYNIDINYGFKYLDSPPVIVNGVTCVPIRAVLEAFSVSVDWNNDTRTVEIFAPHLLEENQKPTITPKPTPTVKPSQKPSVKPTVKPSAKPTIIPDGSEISNPIKPSFGKKEFYFYSQPDSEWEFENNGRGYCWVCSYAMLISNITGERITPVDIAGYNKSVGYEDSAYIASHYGIASTYGLRFVKAIPEDSVYFDYYDSQKRGATYLKVETDEDVINALIEALDNNPKGIMVRFEGYPHTMVATGYYGDEVYFNDPAAEHLENVTFEDTCVGKIFELTDISFIQAMELQ